MWGKFICNYLLLVVGSSGRPLRFNRPRDSTIAGTNGREGPESLSSSRALLSSPFVRYFLTKTTRNFYSVYVSLWCSVLVRSQNLQRCFERVCADKTVVMAAGFLLLPESDASFEGSLLVYTSACSLKSSSTRLCDRHRCSVCFVPLWLLVNLNSQTRCY